MSLTTCDECKCFINTDADPDSCIKDGFLCETCREDDAIDMYIHETDKYKDNLINELTLNNKAMKEWIEKQIKQIAILKYSLESIAEFTKGKPIGSDLYSIHIQTYNALEQANENNG